MREDIYSKLLHYSEGDYVPMHMPGAKRNCELFQMVNPYSIDITEIDGFDNMHHANDIILDGFKKCASLFGADESLYLINGSSAGILSAICGATKKGDKVIVARNSHKSVYNAIYINELHPVYLYPELKNIAGIYGAISVDSVEKTMNDHPDATAIIITSPTYEGIVSNITEIAEMAHKAGMVLIVDEAHGAHFNFSSEFPESAVKCGADLVIQSIHKTLPSFTQTALLHMNGNRINRKRIKRYWNIYQTTSPSYLLMGGIDHCMTLLEEHGEQLFADYLKRLHWLRMEISKLHHFELMKVDDLSKIVILVSNGKRLYDILIHKYKIQLEMASVSYVIAMTSIGDTDIYYERFLNALQEIDQIWESITKEDHSNYKCGAILDAEVIMSPYEAVERAERRYDEDHGNSEVHGENQIHFGDVGNKDGASQTNDKAYGGAELVEYRNAIGRISASSVCFYPPGIPLIHPGERISKEAVEIIDKGIKCKLEVLGLEMQQSEELEIKSREEIMLLCLK